MAAVAQPPDGTPATVNAPSDAVELDPVTVTARLRPESEQRVPASIATVGGEALENEGRFSLGDLDSRVANLQLGDLNGTPTVFMRGVGGGGRQVGFEPRTGIYVDGVFMNEPPLTNGLLLDLDRVEVLRGPQGSLFGQNTDAGSISLVTREPGDHFSAQALGLVDDPGERRIAGAVDLPLIGDRLLLRLSSDLAQSDGFTTNLFDNDRPDAFKEAGNRLRLLWNVAPGLRADFAADTAFFSDAFPTGEARTNTAGTHPTALAPYTVDLNTPQRDDRRSSGVATTVNWTTDRFGLTSISAWREAQRQWTIDLDYSPADGESADYLDHYRRWSQELRLSSPVSDSSLQWLGGLYAYGQTGDSDRPTTAGRQIKMFVPSLTPGDVLTVLPRVKTQSAALFGSVDYSLRPELRVSAGLRLVTIDLHLDYTQQSDPDYQALGFSAVNSNKQRERETAVLPDVSLSWDWGPSVTSYARYARGSKSGGFDADVLSGGKTQPEEFSPETVNNFELGLKGQWLGHTLRTNLSAFLDNYRDYQVSQFEPVGNVVLPVISNAGKVQTFGPELDVMAKPFGGLSVRTSAAWLHADYQEFRNGGGPGIDYSGNRTEYAPHWTVDSAVQYRRPVQWGSVAAVQAEVSYAWRSNFYTSPSNLAPYRADDRRLLGFQIGIQDASQQFDLSLYGDNLLGDLYTETLNRGTLGTYYGRYGDPRLFGLRLQYHYN